MTGTACSLCGRWHAAGFAVLDGRRYCIGMRRPTCVELAQEITITDDDRAIPTVPRRPSELTNFLEGVRADLIAQSRTGQARGNVGPEVGVTPGPRPQGFWEQLWVPGGPGLGVL